MDAEQPQRRVLLTGSSGFIASHLHNQLLRKGHHVVPIDIQSQISNPPHQDTRKVDIHETAVVEELLRTHNVDTVIHTAALSHVKHSWDQEQSYWHTNVAGTAAVLEAVKRYEKPIRFLYLSTDEVYGDSPDVKDDSVPHELNPTNPYAKSKMEAEKLVTKFAAENNMPAIIVRSNNVYGSMQYPEKVIPRFICRTLKGLPCQIEGDGSHKRRYLHVTDAAAAIETIMRKGVDGRVYNISTNNQVTNLELASLIVKMIRPQEPIPPRMVRDRIYNDKEYSTSCSNTLGLGWKEEVDWQTGLSSTVEWYRQNYDHWWSDLGDLLSP